MNGIVIVHGPSCLDLASLVAGRLDLPVVPHSDYPSPSDLFREKRPVLVWGPLYEIKENQLTSTALHPYLAYANEVHRQPILCELCQVQGAVLHLDGENLCRVCSQDRLDRQPLTVNVDGTITTEGDSVTVELSAPRTVRKRTGKDTKACLVAAISSAEEMIPGPGTHNLVLVTPRSLGDGLLSQVKEELKKKNILVEWK